jgi:hypothetical protein
MQRGGGPPAEETNVSWDRHVRIVSEGFQIGRAWTNPKSSIA